jgi:hypothetical protein
MVVGHVDVHVDVNVDGQKEAGVTMTTARARLEPPAADEHHPYYGRYISRVPAGDFIAYVRRQADEVARFFGGMSEAQGDFAYAAGKWTIKELLGHVIDAERVFMFRALSFARADPNPLPSFEQDDWVGPSGAAGRRLAGLVAEWTAVRAATVAFLEGLPADAPLRRGIASEREFTVRALLYGVAGHADYHLEVVREKYMAAPGWPGARG